MRRYPNAAEGLRMMFIGQMLAIVGTLLLWIPLVGSLLAIAGSVVELLGVYKAGNDDENYRGALVFAALVLGINLVAGFMKPGLLLSLMNVASEICSLLLVYTVCNTTSNLLYSMGLHELSQRGQTVIKIYAGCTAVSILCRVLGIIPIINIAAWLVSGVASLVLVAGYVMYLVFLNGSSKRL